MQSSKQTISQLFRVNQITTQLYSTSDSHSVYINDVNEA